jgi:ribosomal protein S18 acetylase RimI-like enzyme
LDPQDLTLACKDTWLRWLSNAPHVHRHAGWLPTFSWLGQKSSLFLPAPNGDIAACLIACPDGLGTAWIHVFAADTPPGVALAWGKLWPAARLQLSEAGIHTLWVMSTQSWFAEFLKSSGFLPAGQVVALSLHPRQIFVDSPSAHRVRYMQEAEVEALLSLDHEAFQPPWRMDAAAFHETFRRSLLATVLDSPTGEPIGYQMSIPTTQGVHLARLAIRPPFQGHGYGRTLMVHLLNHFHRRRAPVITLNTQSDNTRSFRLYHGLGFQEAGEIYPYFQIGL